MPFESATEKFETKETELPEETKRVLLEFINDRYPKSSVLKINQNMREESLKALGILESDWDEMDKLLYLKVILNSLRAHLSTLDAKNKPELAGKKARFENTYKALSEYLK